MIDEYERAEPRPLVLNDLAACAFLVAKGYEIIRTEREPGRRFHLEFHFPPEAEGVVDEFYADAPIGARSYARALSDVKGVIRRTARLEERKDHVRPSQ